MFKNMKTPYEKAKVFPFIPTGEYYFHRGIKAFDRFDFEKAKKYLKRAYELEPLEPVIACQLAIVYTESGDYEESNRLLLHILENLDERMTECHYFLANNYAHLGLFTDAFKHAKLYLELDKVGEFVQEANDLMELIGLEEDEEFDSLLHQDEMITKLEAARGLMETGDFKQAVKMLEESITAFPDFWPAFNNLALAYFYLGETAKAASILEQVLKNSPGNLHALCNMAVFLHYEGEIQQLEELLSALDKVQPMLFEHRFKLGATFALTGKYEKAYYWLRQLQKTGYEGDTGFFYWLAKSAYLTGNEKIAYSAWEQLKQLNPEQGKTPPWSTEQQSFPGHHTNNDQNGADLSILHLSQSDYLEERLLSLFLISISKRKRDLLVHEEFNKIEAFTITEKVYLAYVMKAEINKHQEMGEEVKKAHEIALLLYSKYEHSSSMAQNVVLRSFVFFISLTQSKHSIQNINGIAAAIEYIWLQERNNKKAQAKLAEEYSISIATLRKYIQLLKGLED